MATYLTIEYSGTEKSLADWGIALAGIIGEFHNQQADTLRVRVPGKLVTDDPLFAFESTIIFRINRTSATGAAGSFSGGSIEFQGKRVSNPLDLRPNYEGVQYEFQGPWYDLERTPFRQKTAAWITSAVGFKYTSSIVLFMKFAAGYTAYVPATSGETITEILQSLLDAYSDNGDPAPYQIGTVDPALNLPSLICKPMMCADALMKCIELSPDCKFYFDYTFTPPKIHCRSQANLTSLSLAIKDGTNHKSLNLVSRPELQARSVIVNYQTTQEENGKTYTLFSTDKYPAMGPDGGLRVIIEDVDLQGSKSRTLTGSIVTTAVAAIGGTLAQRRAWWAAHDQRFEGSKIRFQDTAAATNNAYLPDATAVDAETGDPVDLSAYPNELVDGTIHPWMGFNAKRVKISAKMLYAQYDVDATAGSETATNGKPIRKAVLREHHVEIVVTDGTTGTYWETLVDDPGEGVPIGLAQAVYNSLATLQYEGGYVKVEAAITAGVTHANKLNLTGGRTEWTTMNAQIQSIRKDYGRGETEIRIGPAKHLNAGEIYSLLKFLRFRQTWFSIQSRLSGAATSGTLEITRNAPKKNTVPGNEDLAYSSVTHYTVDNDPTSAVKATIQHDATKITAILAATTPTALDPDHAPNTMRPRKCLLCAEDGGQVFQIIHTGGPFSEP